MQRFALILSKYMASYIIFFDTEMSVRSFPVFVLHMSVALSQGKVKTSITSVSICIDRNIWQYIVNETTSFYVRIYRLIYCY